VIKLRVSEAAARSILEQAGYYREAANDSLALGWESAVDEAVHSLLKLPERGALCGFRSSSLAGIRWISIPGFPRHMVFYRFVPAEKAVVILQVLHGARDLDIVLSYEEDDPK
jgi:plasmid stabilization system protein ParE